MTSPLSRVISRGVCALASTIALVCGSTSSDAAEHSVQHASTDVVISNGQVVGRAIDASGHAVPFATFQLTDSGRQTSFVHCDAVGRFVLAVPTDRSLTIRSGNQLRRLRLWRSTPPPEAVDQVAVIVDASVLRGEDTLMGFNPRTTGTIAAVVGITAAVILLNDDSSPSSP